MNKKYIVSSVILLALVFSFGVRVSAENDDATTATVNSQSQVSVSADVTTAVAFPIPSQCQKIDANLNGKLDVADFASFEKIVNSNNVARGDLDGNKIVNANDLQTFLNMYASCTHPVKAGGGIVTGGIKPAPGDIKPMPAQPVPTSDDAVIKAQMIKCRNLTNDTAIMNCLKTIPAKRIGVTPTDNPDQKNVQSDDKNKDGDEDQVGDETPEQIKKMAARYEQRFAEFNALYTKLTKLADLIDGRIVELSAQKVDVAKAKMRLASAREHLGYARFSIDSTIKIFRTYGAANTNVRGSAEIAKTQLAAARNDLIAATRYLSLHDVLSDACKKFDVTGDNKLGTDDFAAFDAKFKSGDKSADADMNGTLNANDYQTFQNGYAVCASPKITPPPVLRVNKATEPAPVDMKATVNSGADVQGQ